MSEVATVDCETATSDKAPPEFAYLNPPQQCDETMPPYREIKPIYDGHFTNRFPQLDAVRIIILSQFSSSLMSLSVS